MGGVVPVPPAAYWDNVPWWAFMGLLLVVAVFASPLAIQALRGRSFSYASDRQAFAASRDGLEVARAAFLVQLQSSEKEARATLAHERAEWAAERERLEADRDEGWDLGRGMEDKAHWYRHGMNSIAMRFNALLMLFGEYRAGRVAEERFDALIAQIKPAEEGPTVPLLRDVERKKP